MSFSNEIQLTPVSSEGNTSGSTRPKSSGVRRVPKRHIVLTMMVLGYFVMYCVRMCFSVTIVAMTTGQAHKNYSNGRNATNGTN